MKTTRVFLRALCATISLHAQYEYHSYSTAPIQPKERSQGFFEKRFHNKKVLIRRKQSDGSALLYDIRKIGKLLGCISYLLPNVGANCEVLLEPSYILSYLSFAGCIGCSSAAFIKDWKGWIADLSIEVPLYVVSGLALDENNDAATNDFNFDTDEVSNNPNKWAAYFAAHYVLSSAYTERILPWEYEEAPHNQSVTQ